MSQTFFPELTVVIMVIALDLLCCQNYTRLLHIHFHKINNTIVAYFNYFSLSDFSLPPTGFVPRQRPTCPELTKPSILLRSVNWYQLRLEERSPPYGYGVASEGLLLALFLSSFCSQSVSCKKKRVLVTSDVRVAVEKPELY